MDEINLKIFVGDLVEKASVLKNKYTDEKFAPVNYACVFSQNDEEFKALLESASQIGKIVKETPTGPLFHIHPIDTVSGKLKLLKIRLPDKTRPERGDADFTVGNYDNFKKKTLPTKFFKLIERKEFEMIELMEPGCDVRAYFSNLPLAKQLKIS